MLYFWLALGAPLLAAALIAFWRPKWILQAAISAGIAVGAATAGQPLLFRAENGFWMAFLMFGLASAVIAMLVGLLVQIIHREVAARYPARDLISARRPPNDR